MFPFNIQKIFWHKGHNLISFCLIFDTNATIQVIGGCFKAERVHRLSCYSFTDFSVDSSQINDFTWTRLEWAPNLIKCMIQVFYFLSFPVSGEQSWFGALQTKELYLASKNPFEHGRKVSKRANSAPSDTLCGNVIKVI